ncbi:membrane-spanning 4-domains subfamily A member 4A [Trachinotus anak]|uniref:membrane-spanning 4-domains subfamily A member 4A n=1 Tax=Trachinotus anak TaxID=443729 RepID=UPI0039F196A2
MKKTFVCNESMIITIPIGNLRDTGAGPLMPEKFHCVFKDSYKVFVVKGKPKPLGAAQATAGVFLCTLGLVFIHPLTMIYALPSILFVVSGMVSYAAGQIPNMHVAKLSFSLNIISFFWSIAAFSISMIHFIEFPHGYYRPTSHSLMAARGVSGLIMSLLVVENLLALFLIYWLSKAICRQDFNTLPIILLKRAD